MEDTGDIRMNKTQPPLPGPGCTALLRWRVTIVQPPLACLYPNPPPPPQAVVTARKVLILKHTPTLGPEPLDLLPWV